MAWRKANPEKYCAVKKRAYEKRKAETGKTGYEDPEKKKSRMAIYRDEHREKLRQQSRDRYHRMAATEEGRLYWLALVHRRLDKGSLVSAAMLREVIEEQTQDGKVFCFYCHESVDKYHIDHMKPLSRGGKSTKDNLCVACPTCNLSKHTQTAEEFMERRAV